VRLFKNFEALVGCAVCTVSMPRRKVGRRGRVPVPRGGFTVPYGRVG